MAAGNTPFEGLLSFPAHHKHMIDQLRECSYGHLPKNASLRADTVICFVWSFRKLVPESETNRRFRLLTARRARKLSIDYAKMFWREDLNQPVSLQMRKRLLLIPEDVDDPLAAQVQSMKMFCLVSAGKKQWKCLVLGRFTFIKLTLFQTRCPPTGLRQRWTR